MDLLRLFDSPAAPPTTRPIALTVQRDGSGALDQAQRRADDARYQEITCRSALNPVKGMPFAWTLNPYRGCTHALSLLLRAALPDAVRARPRRRVLVADLREGQLRRGAAAGAGQAFVEARAGRSRHGDRSVSADRRPLQAHAAFTRGAVGRADAGRDRDQGPDDRARRRPPGGARRASPVHRLPQRADGRRRRLARARAWNGASAAAPSCGAHAEKGGSQRRRADGADRPGFTTQSATLDATIRACADHDAAFMGANVLYLKDGTKDHFMGFLRHSFPEMAAELRASVSGRVRHPRLRRDRSGPGRDAAGEARFGEANAEGDGASRGGRTAAGVLEQNQFDP